MGIFQISPLTGSTLTVIVASAAGVLLLIATIALVYARRRQQRRAPFDLSLEDIYNDSLSVKSAPSSRHASPRPTKRMSCPDIRDHMAVAGPCPDQLPDISLAGERVQPRGSLDSSMHPSPRLPRGGGDVHTTTATSSVSHAATLHYRHDASSGAGGTGGGAGVGGLGGSVHQAALASRVAQVEQEMSLPRSAHGRLWYSLLYDTVHQQLSVTLVKVTDLSGRGAHNHARDPFVKVYVLPDERTCRTSKVCKKTLFPVYNETFHFQVPESGIEDRTLRFSVYDVDKRKVRHSLGHVVVPLRDVILDSCDTYWSDLETNTQGSASQLGEIQLGLCYQPQKEKLKVTVLKARGFKPSCHAEYQARLHVRLQLYYGRKLNRTKYTASRDQRKGGEEAEVDFNEGFSFSLAGKQLESCRLETTLMKADPPYRPAADVEECGRVVLGPFMYARGEMLQHWQLVLAQPRVTVTRWHAMTTPPAPHHQH